jgi:hypothetical protein
MLQGEADVGMRQRRTAERFLAMAVLGGFGAKEFAARRRVEIELVHGHCRAVGKRRGLRCIDLPAVDFDTPGVRLATQPRGQGKA